MSERPPEIALLHHQYGPYHVARARTLQERAPAPVHFIQLASQERAREWRVDGPSVKLVTVGDGTLEQMSPRRLAAGVQRVLDELRPDVVVVAGYAHAAMRAAARWSRRNAAAAILLSDSHTADRTRHVIKEWAKRVWVSRHFDAAFVAGAASAAYAESLGFPRCRIWRGYDVVDNAFFARGAAEARARGTTLLRELGLPDRVFLYVGRFSPEKNLHRLLDAMEVYRRRAGDEAWGLLLVGGGPDAASIEERARALHGSVAVTEFKQSDALAGIYGAAGALMLPSTSEPWGLVVNEAMAAGLPVLVSDHAGAAFELVVPGVNGYVFDPFRVESLVEVMLRMSSDQVDRRAMGEASQRIIANFTLETWTASLLDAVEVTRARRARKT